jgi:lipid II:glycine glycyltransferase (peptidoglycan interpeptide bridge formation enzyme)
MLLPLPESSRILMESLKSKVRSQVKKPTRDGLSASLGGSELLPDFYPIFCGNMRDLGSPVHSRSWFESVFCSFGPRARCGLVRMPDGMPAACGIILLHANTVSIPWASSLKRCNRFNPNMLLYWTFLEHAADSGYACFDFGRSTPGEGTHRFKAQWGAQEQPLHWVRILTRTGEVIPLESSSQGRLRSLVEACFRRLPIPAATFLGSRLRRYIPL